jgi:hypothetical protein
MSVGSVETRVRPMSGSVVARRRRVAAMFGILLFLGVTAAALLLVGLRNSPQPMVPILRANREIMPGTRITANDLTVAYVFVQDPSLLPTLARDTDRGRLIGQTAVVGVPAGALVPANVAVSQTSAAMWEAAVPVKRMPGDLRAGDHVALLVEGTQSGRSVDVVVMQDVQVLRVGSDRVDLWLPYKSAPQIEWFADHGGIVVLKTQPGIVHNDVTTGGGQ